jgi:hypothetical protein
VGGAFLPTVVLSNGGHSKTVCARTAGLKNQAKDLVKNNIRKNTKDLRGFSYLVGLQQGSYY